MRAQLPVARSNTLTENFALPLELKPITPKIQGDNYDTELGELHAMPSRRSITSLIPY